MTPEQRHIYRVRMALRETVRLLRTVNPIDVAAAVDYREVTVEAVADYRSFFDCYIEALPERGACETEASR